MFCTEVGIYRYDFLAMKVKAVVLRMRINVKDTAFGRSFNKMLLRFFLGRVMLNFQHHKCRFSCDLKPPRVLSKVLP